MTLGTDRRTCRNALKAKPVNVNDYQTLEVLHTRDNDPSIKKYLLMD